MKKISLLIILLLLILTGCKENKVELPVIKIIGDKIVTVAVGDQFIDPGAEIEGDFDLEINVDSNVNVNIAGTYTVTYSVTYEGKTYSGTRTVVVENKVDELVLNILGDEEITITVGDEFVDPGAELSSDFNLEIEVNSNVDVNIPGTYTITYSVTYEGITYSATRTVIVESSNIYEHVWDITITSKDITDNSITFTVDINDNMNMLNNAKAVLYNGTVFVSEKVFADGMQDLIFTNLNPSTEYKLVLEADYTENGISKTLVNQFLIASTLPTSVPTVVLTDSEEQITSIEVSLDVVDYRNVIVDACVKLYYGDYEMEQVSLNSGLNVIVFDELSPGDTYTIKVDYSYNDIETSQLVEINSNLGDFTTLTPPKPELLYQYCSVSTNSVVCTVEFDNRGFESDAFYYAQLYTNGVYVATAQITNSYTTFTFTDLNEITHYVINLQANYTESSTQNTYSDITIDTIEFTTDQTQEVVIPSLSNLDITKTPNEVTVNYTLNDPSYIFISGEAKVYDSNQNLVDGSIIFIGTNTFTLSNHFLENSDYTLKFIISHYDENSNIVQDVILYEETLSLPPTISLVDMVESDIVYTTTDMVLKITLNNPSGILINSVKINGTDYSSITNENNNSILYVNIGNYDTSGDKSITLNSLGMTLSDGVFDYLMDYNQIITVYNDNSNVPTDATIEILKVVTDNFMVKVEDGQTATNTFTVHLRNDYNLEIDSLFIDGAWYEREDLQIISPKLVRFTGEIHEGVNDFGVYYIKFSKNSTIETFTQDYNNTVSVYGYNSDDIIYIHNATEFVNIKNDLNGIYYLANDIDMSGVNFNPIGNDFGAFTGLFNGNGYTISNISMTRIVPNASTYPTTNQSFGLFGKSSGYICNFVINNINLTVNSDPENNINVGTVVGVSSGVLNDVQVMGNASVTVNNANTGSVGGLVGYNASLVSHSSSNANITVDADSPQFYGSIYGIGGLVGINDDGNIEYSSATGDVSFINNGMLTSVQVGGLIGSVKDGSRISNSYSLGNVSNNGNFTGGLIGYVYNGTVYINYTYATGNVSGYQNKVGGLIGSTNTNTHVSNSFAVGDVTSVMGNPGALFGYENPYSIKNCFKYNAQVIKKDGIIVTPRDHFIDEIVAVYDTNLETTTFYKDNILFTDLNWDFNNLDFSQGEFPKIK